MRPFQKISLLLLAALCGISSFAAAGEMSAQDFLKTQAAASYHEGKYEQALQSLTQLLKETPGDPLLLRYRAMTLDRLGRFDEAVGDFKTVLAQDPNHIPARFFLGNTYHRMGRHDEAVREWRWVVENAGGTIYEQWAKESLERAASGQGIKKAEPFKKWNVAGRYGYEYDTNVTLKPEDDVLASPGDSSAGRHLLDLVLKNHAVSTARTKIDVQGAVRQSLHDSGLGEFNFTSLEFGVNARQRVDFRGRDYILGAKYDISGGFLDGATFSFKNRVTFSVDTRFTTYTRSVLSYRLTGTNFGPDGSNPPVTSRDGIYQDLGLTQYWYSHDFKQYVFATGEYNNASTRGNNFDSDGFTTRVGFHTPILKKTDLDASVEYEYAHYPRFVSLSSLDTDRRRNSDWDFYVALTHYLTPEIGIQIFNRYILADNSNGFYAYDRNISGVQVLYSKSY